MRGNLKRRFVYEDLVEQEPPVPSQMVQSGEPWRLKLSGGQLFGVWLGISGMLLATFIAGLYTGRDQGIRYALNEQGREAVRMPIAHAVIASDDSRSNVLDSVTLTSSLTSVTPTANHDQKPQEKQAVKYDFSNSVVTGVSGLVSTSGKSSLPTNNPSKSPQGGAGIPSGSQSEGRYFVQIGTVKSFEQGLVISKGIDKEVFPVKVQETDILGKQYFRVLVGPFATKQIADDQKNKLTALGGFSTQPFVRLIP